jgi:plasmid stabilization system protein ParE
MTRELHILPSARTDIKTSFDYLEEQSDLETAWRFFDGVQESLARIEQMPFIGSPRRFRSSRIRDLRQWPVSGFEDFQIFYRVTSKRIDVHRILHGRRDLKVIFETED